MATLEEAIVTRLNAVAALTALVADRITPAPLPQGSALPAITFQKISGPRVSAMGADTGLTHPRYQFSCFAQEAGGKSAYLNALDVAEQLRKALQRYRGTVAGVVIQAVYLEGEYDIPRDERSALIARGMDFVVWAQET